jgi:hypothetical protein
MLMTDACLFFLLQQTGPVKQGEQLFSSKIL